MLCEIDLSFRLAIFTMWSHCNNNKFRRYSKNEKYVLKIVIPANESH